MNTPRRSPYLPKQILESFKDAYRQTDLPELTDEEADAVAQQILSGVGLVVDLAAKRKEPPESN